jgi:uncharacterized protein YybS (DUF2232 family)
MQPPAAALNDKGEILMTQTRSLAESALLTGLSVLLYIGSNIPLVGMLLIFLSPVPLVILEMRHDLRRGFLALLAGSLLVAAIEGPVQALSYALGFAVLGLALGRIIELKRSAVEILAVGSAVSLVCKLALAVIMFYVTGLNPMNLDMSGMERAMDMMLKMPVGLEQAAAMKHQMETMMKVMPLIIPAVFILVSVIDTALCYWISGKVVRRLSHFDLPKLPPFNMWRFHPSVLWAFLAALICLVVGARDPRFAFLTRAGLNLQVLTQFIFVLQGMSLAAWFMDRAGWGRGVRNFVLALVFVIPIFSTIANYTGIFDMCWNLRTHIGGADK